MSLSGICNYPVQVQDEKLAVKASKELRSCFPSKKVLLGTLLLITTVSVVLLTKYSSFKLQRSSSPTLSAYIGFAAFSKENYSNATNPLPKQDSPLQTKQNGTLQTKQDGTLQNKQDNPLQTKQNGALQTKQDGTLQNGTVQQQKQAGDPKLNPQEKDPTTKSQKANDTSKQSGNTLGNVSISNSPGAAVISEKPAGPGPKKAYVTYDASVVIECSDSSPYVFCSGRPGPRSKSDLAADAARHPPWKFSLARALGWTPKVDMSVCRFNNCVDVGSYPRSDTDVVGFNLVGLKDDYSRPSRTSSSSQNFAGLIWESPVHTRASFTARDGSIWNREINLAMSYRVDSDVFVPYGLLAFEPRPLNERPNYYEIASKKSKLVAWFVSNCNTGSRRMDYVKKMKEYIQVDIFGGCGTPCPRNKPGCENSLMDKYKFYLSFENSFCTDYVTEKFFKVYRENTYVLPVARGGADYNKYFPANTFVNAADFPSPRQLAEHLKSLGSDNKRFAQMLEQKDMYRWFDGHSAMWCALCERLNTKGLSQKTVNLKQWWSDGHCRSPTDIG